jgi:hypothetical protein
MALGLSKLSFLKACSGPVVPLVLSGQLEDLSSNVTLLLPRLWEEPPCLWLPQNIASSK